MVRWDACRRRVNPGSGALAASARRRATKSATHPDGLPLPNPNSVPDSIQDGRSATTRFRSSVSGQEPPLPSKPIDGGITASAEGPLPTMATILPRRRAGSRICFGVMVLVFVDSVVEAKAAITAPPEAVDINPLGREPWNISVREWAPPRRPATLGGRGRQRRRPRCRRWCR
jgi:hypothetical protein